jgi:tRNA (guanosine-2'-O-)-methyltransferase
MTNERRDRLEAVLSKRQNDLTVVLENVFDPHNISAVMRSCDAVGIQEIFVLNNRIPRHKKFGARSSSSAAKWLTVRQFDDAEECFLELRKTYPLILTTHLSSDAVSLYELNLSQPGRRQFHHPAGGHDPVPQHQRRLRGNALRSLPAKGSRRALQQPEAGPAFLRRPF